MNAVNQFNSGKEAVIGLASASLKIIAENPELINFVEARDKTPERRLDQVGINDPSDIAIGEPMKKEGRIELTETATKYS